MKKTFLVRLLSVTLILGLVSAYITPQNVTAEIPTPQTIVTTDQAVLDEIATNGSSSYWLNFRSKSDLSKAETMDWSERGWYVYEQLQKAANASQAQVIKYLESNKIPYKSYWIKNAVLVESSGLGTLKSLQSFAELESITARKTFILYEPEKSATLNDNDINAIEPNLTHINADDVWAIGIDGAGIVVANIDTGVRYSHQALVGQYRGNNGGTFDHNYNWFDPYNEYTVPTDANGHGTHTMGTMVGDDGVSNQIGVAPGASWMACRACNTSSCTDTALLGCGQWIAAPTDLTGANANPDMRPNVVNNSWGDCGTTYNSWYEGPIAAWHAAGIYPIFSNGNASNCVYSSPPGLNTVGNPARSGNVTGVGSSGESNGQYATHSNWGPTDNLDTVNPTGGFDEMKPQVIAPGVNIRSSTPGSDSEYQKTDWTGTSMSAPHVSGLIALMWQAAPCLIGDYAKTENIIEETAVHITYEDGSTDTPTNYPNYATGWGEIDALAAVTLAKGYCSMGTLTGTVSDGTYHIEGVSIFADDGAGFTRSTLTGPDGTYSLGLPAGTYSVTASKYGYTEQTETDTIIIHDTITSLHFVLLQLGMSLVSGHVYDGGVPGVGSHGYPLYSSIHIKASGFDQTIYTDPFTGYYEIGLVESTEHTFVTDPVPNGYDPLLETITPTGTADTHDIYVPVEGICTAPGYVGSVVPVIAEAFESGTLPGGWVNHDYAGNGQIWQFNDPFPRGNLTPGAEGGFAILDSDKYGEGNAQDAGLRTPPLDFTGDATVFLDFDTDFNWYSSLDSATVRVSADGGTTWTTPVWTQTVDFNGHVTLDISTQAANHANVIVEFKYVGSWGFWWQVDDVVIAPMFCALAEGGVVAGYVYDDTTDLPLVGADVYSAEVATQTFFIPEDPKSEGLYWVFQPMTGPSPVSVQSLSGSNVVFDPTAGGAASAEPGVPTTLCFESNTYTEDYEYVYDTWLKFPMDWIITSAYRVGTPTCDFGSWSANFTTYWETEPYEIDIKHSAFLDPIDHCVAEYCVDVTPGASAGLVSWYFDGDGYNNVPHHPCSIDGYTPASMVGDECDESVNPQAKIPMGLPEPHDFAAEKDLYGSSSATVIVQPDFLVQQDFYLGTGQLDFDPTSLERTMIMGEPAATETLTISNLGTSDASFELIEKDEGYVLPTLMIPAFKGELPESKGPASFGPAPQSAKPPALAVTPNNPMQGILSGESAFAVDAMADALKYIPDTTIPGTWSDIGTTAASLYAGDFIEGDFSTLYAIKYDDNNFYTVDVTTGAATLVGSAANGQYWTGLSGTPDGTLYGLTTDGSTTTLLIVDPTTAALTTLGTIPGVTIGIDLAYNTDNGLIYIVDIGSDSLFTVDPDSMITTLVGSLGIDANFAQGLDYEEESGVLYWAAYNVDTMGVGELRIIDTTTGASALVGQFPGGTEVDCLAFATGGVSDVPWFSEAPVSGTVTPAAPVEVTVTFDPTGAGLSQPGDYLAALKVKHDTPNTYPLIPVVLHLVAPANYGTLKGHVYGFEACDINPAALGGATINFWQGGTIMYTTTTTPDGYYTYALPDGMYDIEVVYAGYLSVMAEDVEVPEGLTATHDFTLRLISPCLSVVPTSLVQTQKVDQITTQILTIENTGAGDGTIELVEIAGGYQSPAGSNEGKVPTYLYSPDKDLPGVDKSRTMPIGKMAPSIDSNLPTDILLSEGFEAAFPPSDWTQVVNNASFTWTQSDQYYYEGMYGARVPWNYAQDEWLLTPELALVEGTLSLYSQGNVYWCRDTYDNCDLNVWLIVGEVGGGDDIFVKNLDEDWTSNWSWTQASIDLAPYLPGSPVRIGFQLIGDDDADVAIDSVTLDGFEGLDVPWLSEDPVTAVVPADGTLDVDVTFNSTGLVIGDYLATLHVRNAPAPAIKIPVTLHVVDNSAPVAQAQSVTTPEETPLDITLVATDVNGDPLTYSVVGGPIHGTLSGDVPNLTYTPALNYNGEDSFTFIANDGTADSLLPATVSITVTPSNDKPVANAQSVTTAEDTAKAITLVATDVDSLTLTYVVVAQPTHGTVVVAGTVATYTPALNYNGADSFTFKATDGIAESNIATVTITVTPVNDAPVAEDQAVSTAEGTAKAITLIATDVDSLTLTYVVVAQPTHGTVVVAGAVATYTPTARYFGSDSFKFKANDSSEDSNVATVTITVNQTTRFIFLPIIIR